MFGCIISLSLSLSLSPSPPLPLPLSPLPFFLLLPSLLLPSLLLPSLPLSPSRRISLRKDTISVAALSINTSDKVHPIIWSVGNLPFDCSYFLPIPQPLGESQRRERARENNLVHTRKVGGSLITLTCCNTWSQKCFLVQGNGCMCDIMYSLICLFWFKLYWLWISIHSHISYEIWNLCLLLYLMRIQLISFKM